MRAAVRATKRIGTRAVVIEVNDNLNAGVEDKVLKQNLYRAVIGEYVRRLEQ